MTNIIKNKSEYRKELIAEINRLERENQELKKQVQKLSVNTVVKGHKLNLT